MLTFATVAGEYPTCATSTSEAADENADVRRRRGMLSAVATDFAIDMGFVFAGIVVLIVLAAYNYKPSEGLWRVTFGLGLVLPVALLFVRMRLVNSTQYHKHAMKKQIPYLLVIKRYWKPMIGTSMAWFVYDFVVSNTDSRTTCAFPDLLRHILLAFSALQFWPHSTPVTVLFRPWATERCSTVSTCLAAFLVAFSWTRLDASKP